MAASPFLPVLADAVNPLEVLVNPAVVPSTEQISTNANDASTVLSPSTAATAKKNANGDLEQWIPPLVLVALITIGIGLGSRASAASKGRVSRGGAGAGTGTGAGARVGTGAGVSLMGREDDDDDDDDEDEHLRRHRRAQRADDELLARAVKRQQEQGKLQIL